MPDSIVVGSTEGRLRGYIEDGVAAFRNVPFASPPTGALRFMPPQPPRPWSDVRDAGKNGPICPQLPARLAQLMGPIDAAQDEDCLTLTIWAPQARERARPVLVWFHGGGYASGAGSLPWYSGERIAREGDIIVVGVNYRVGALGYLFSPGLVSGNMGLHDQIAALNWIRRNIAHFGGDADRITLMGQSGGAHSITCMMAMPATRSLVRQAILMSTPFGMQTIPAAAAAESAAAFCAALKIEPTEPDALARLQNAAVPDILQAQLAVMRRPWRPPGDPTPPFGPTAVGDLPAGAAFEQAVLVAAAHVDAIIGTTRDEMSPFYAQDPRIQNASHDAWPKVAESLFGASASARMNAAQQQRDAGTQLQAFCHAQNVHYFVEGAYRLAEGISAAGRTARVYQFDWPSPNTAWGACHCMELPFVFGSWTGFDRAPMLGAIDPRAEALSTTMRGSLCRFVANGDPNGNGIPQWPSFDAQHRAVMHFDATPGVQPAPRFCLA